VDAWSAGVVLFVLLGGYPPFWAESEPVLFGLVRRGHFTFDDPAWASVSERCVLSGALWATWRGGRRERGIAAAAGRFLASSFRALTLARSLALVF